jgi:hydrogenase nickel incorporation protein HypA/HybF
VHEGGLCEGVLAVVEEAAGGQPVNRVRLRVGRLQRVVAESFDLYWQMLAGETTANALVELVETPILIRCRGCGGEHEAADAIFLCPGCDSADVELLAGDSVAVEEIELAGGEIVRNPSFADVREDHHHIHG